MQLGEDLVDGQLVVPGVDVAQVLEVDRVERETAVGCLKRDQDVRRSGDQRAGSPPQLN